MPLKNKPTDVIVVSSGLAGNRMGWGVGGGNLATGAPQRQQHFHRNIELKVMSPFKKCVSPKSTNDK